MKTKQEIFNQVAAHLMTQKEPAKDSAGDCAYRGLHGHQCAVGCLIEDEHYNSYFEGILITIEHDSGSAPTGQNRLLHDALLASGVDVADADVEALLAELQQLHDNVDAESWIDELPVIADCLNLTFTPEN